MVLYWTFNMLYKIFLTKLFLNLSLVNTVLGTVRILLGKPLSAMYLSKISTTLFLVGDLMNFASDQPVKLSMDTIRYFFELRAILKCPAKSMATSSLRSTGTGILPYCFCTSIRFIDLPAFLQSGSSW